MKDGAGLDAIVVPAGGGEANTAFGLPRRILVPSAAVGGAYCAFEEMVPPGAGPPLHIHRREQEFFFVRAGVVRFRCEDATLELGPGGALSIPAGARHAFRNVGGHEARLLVTVTPGGLDGFFREIERRGLGPDDMAAVMEIAARHNLEFVGPPID